MRRNYKFVPSRQRTLEALSMCSRVAKVAPKCSAFQNTRAYEKYGVVS